MKIKIMLVLTVIISTLFASTPKITIITSLFKGGDYIEGFMKDIIRQSIFGNCELIIVDAHSPDNEFEIIKPYVERFSNVIYYPLPDEVEDPGLYGCWNIAIQMARGEYIINANVDDRLAPNAIEILSKALDEHPYVDLVYSACYVSRDYNDTWEMLHRRPWKVLIDWPEFSRKRMRVCLPGNHPMWRKSLHGKIGYYDSDYKAAGDWEFFLRAVEAGAIFRKVPGVLGTFYKDPKGEKNLTRNPLHGKEMHRIATRYKHIWEN